MSIKINLDYQATIILTNQFIFDFLLSLTLAIKLLLLQSLFLADRNINKRC